MAKIKGEDRKGKVIYFSHGGGPLPILGDKSHKAMIQFVEHLPSIIGKPDTIIVISAHWEEAPAARYCHPREEHLLPLHVCVGIAGENSRAEKIFDDYILGKRAVAFQW